jgi:hypothetical protein
MTVMIFTTAQMTPLFKKLNLGMHTIIHVLNAPASFESALAALRGVAVKKTMAGSVNFAMAFVVTQAALDDASAALVRACEGDAVLWMVYPKKTSKKYQCEFNRDTGWRVLGDAGFEPVRMVAINEDWSALRFRKVVHIKKMTRDVAMTISTAGKRKASAKSA